MCMHGMADRSIGLAPRGFLSAYGLGWSSAWAGTRRGIKSEWLDYRGWVQAQRAARNHGIKFERVEAGECGARRSMAHKYKRPIKSVIPPLPLHISRLPIRQPTFIQTPTPPLYHPSITLIETQCLVSACISPQSRPSGTQPLLTPCGRVPPYLSRLLRLERPLADLVSSSLRPYRITTHIQPRRVSSSRPITSSIPRRRVARRLTSSCRCPQSRCWQEGRWKELCLVSLRFSLCSSRPVYLLPYPDLPLGG